MSRKKERCIVRLPDDVVAKCYAWAASIAEHYGAGGGRTALPWSRDEFSAAELRLWLATRTATGLNIDVQTCEIGCWYAGDLDLYGILGLESQMVDKYNFVRSPQSDGWVCECDLPMAKQHALYDRIQRGPAG